MVAGEMVALVVAVLALVLTACCCMNLCKKRYQMKRLQEAAKKNVRSEALLPLVAGRHVDTKINVSGRAGCAQARSKLPLIAVAALEGNERVMRQLAEQGADLSYREILSDLNLLHMTIKSNVPLAVLWCVDNIPKAQLDQRGCCGHRKPDRGGYGDDINMTALQMVILRRSLSVGQQLLICKALIDAGCDVTIEDSIHTSTLSHATKVLVDRKLRSLIIKATPFGPGRVYMSWWHAESPLEDLLADRDFHNAWLLVEAGYDLRADVSFKQHAEKLKPKWKLKPEMGTKPELTPEVVLNVDFETLLRSQIDLVVGTGPTPYECRFHMENSTPVALRAAANTQPEGDACGEDVNPGSRDPDPSQPDATPALPEDSCGAAGVELSGTDATNTSTRSPGQAPSDQSRARTRSRSDDVMWLRLTRDQFDYLSRFKEEQSDEEHLFLFRLLEQEMTSPAPLRRMCRTAIRAAIGGVRLQAKLGSLGLPAYMVSFLRLDGVTLPDMQWNPWSNPEQN